MLLLVCGSSCSGKSTVAVGLGPAEGLAVHEFNEFGIPSDADTRWRQETLDRWVLRAVEYQASGIDVLLIGQSPIGEVLAAPSAGDLEALSVCLLDCRDEERRRRIRQRDGARWSDQEVEDLVAWARWHRAHAADPRYQPEVLTLNGWESMRWERWASWSAGDDRWSVATIDSSDAPVQATVSAVGSWVRRARGRG